MMRIGDSRATHWQVADRRLRLSPPLVMGVLNVTPDSFSDGGRFLAPDQALAHARAMVQAGADIIDIGGESTRPGAVPATLDEERSRVMPVMRAIRGELDVPLSIDTSKPEIMREALSEGAAIINDVNGFRADGALEAVADAGAGLCIMHMQGQPRTMQHEPNYRDVVVEVLEFLADRAEQCERFGVARERICIDPGFGFGKTLDHNLDLLRQLGAFADTGYPVLVGVSRKSMLGAITGKATDARMAASVSAALLAADRGAGIVRVHDVAETADALAVWSALQGVD